MNNADQSEQPKSEEELVRLYKKAKSNARRLRNKDRFNPNRNATVRPEFWDQVAGDYARQISIEYRRKNSISTVSGVGIMKP